MPPPRPRPRLSRDHREEEGYYLPMSEVVRRAKEAWDMGATEVCIQAGLPPQMKGDLYIKLCEAVKAELPDIHVHGFSPEEFGALHPGGQLGRRFLRVGDIMHRGADVPLIDGAEPMTEALINMTAKSFGCVGITNADDHLIGIITDGDLRRHMDNGLLARAAREVMTESPKTISADALAAGALALMKDRQITSLFVVENRSPVGILHIHYLLRAGSV